MIIKEDLCVACETCMNCGRKYDYFYHVCDECESDEQLYEYEGMELCAECLLSRFEKVDMEDFDQE